MSNNVRGTGTAPRQSWQIAYDIGDPRRLRRVERLLAGVGTRQHMSLFLCDLTAAQLRALQERLIRTIEPAADTVRYTPLCVADRGRVLHVGGSVDIPSTSSWVV